GAAVTVNVALQVTSVSQSLLTVQVTVVEPPQAEGTPELSLLMLALQPPLKVVVASQAAKAASIAVWLWQAASVALVAQFSATAGARESVGVGLRVTVVS